MNSAWMSSSRVARAARVGTVVLLALVVARTGQVGLVTLGREVASLAARDQVITVAGGDVALRDVPKAHELRRGRLFSDPYYAGERHWYPFLTPAVAAVVSAMTGSPMPVAYFGAEAGFVMLALAATMALAFFVGGWAGLLCVPVAVLLGALQPGNGLYPIESVRGGFCLFLIYAGLVWQRGAPLAPRRAAILGLSVVLLGLWNGAAFAVAGAVAAIAALLTLGEARRRPVELWRLLPLAAGVLVPMALLFGPQLLRHGHLAVPEAARVWSAEIYQGGTILKALTLPLGPRGITLALFAALVARLLLGRRLGLAPWPRLLPVVVAYVLALLLAHLGFVAADGAHPVAARVARSLLPAPAHTFLATAEVCRPVIVVAGLLALGQLAWRALERRVPARPWFPAIMPVAAFAACAVLVFTFPYRYQRFSSSESAPFFRFGREVGDTVNGRPVFFRYPGRFVQSSALKIFKLSVPEYANPYVHRQRLRAEQDLDAALARGDVAAADALLSRYDMGFVMEDPRAPADPVIQRCGGPVLAEHAGYRLRPRVPCRR